MCSCVQQRSAGQGSATSARIALAELVARPGEREGDVGVQALQAPVAAGAADAEVERRVVPVACQLAADAPLLLVRAREALGQHRRRSRAASVQRSTPPAASSRETAATRCGQVR